MKKCVIAAVTIDTNDGMICNYAITWYYLVSFWCLTVIIQLIFQLANGISQIKGTTE